MNSTFLVVTIPFSPVALQLGPLAIRWYGVGYVVAITAGLWLAGRHLQARDITAAQYSNLAFGAIVVGLLGARLYYDLQSGFGWFLTHPQHLLAVWEGGMAYFDAVFAVPVFIFLYSWRARPPFWIVADAAVLFAAIGRIGNILNGEGDLLGPPSNLPWASAYTSPNTMAPARGVGYQPAAAYELLIGLAILVMLLLVRERLRPPAGALFLVYLGMYGLSQIGIFFVRTQNSITTLGLRQAQLSRLILLVIAATLVIAWRRWPQAGLRLEG
jgi:phosphatidylglycerol:prolipoprotein diacylglycerol transferase